MRGWLRWPLVAAVVVMGCGDSTAPTVSGSFAATVTGEVAAELQGIAEFGIYPDEGFGLTMSGGAAHLLGIGERAEVRPGVGVRPIGDPDDGGFFALYLVQTTTGVAAFISRSGQFEVTVSRPDRVEGSFTINMFGDVPGEEGEREVHVSGTFSATCAGNALCD